MNVDVADVKPSLLSWMVVGIMATTFIIFFRFLFGKWQVPGLSPLFASLGSA